MWMYQYKTFIFIILFAVVFKAGEPYMYKNAKG